MSLDCVLANQWCTFVLGAVVKMQRFLPLWHVHRGKSIDAQHIFGPALFTACHGDSSV